MPDQGIVEHSHSVNSFSFNGRRYKKSTSQPTKAVHKKSENPTIQNVGSKCNQRQPDVINIKIKK